MKPNLFLLFIIAVLTSCNNFSSENTFSAGHLEIQPEIEENLLSTEKQHLADCEKYWKNRFPDDNFKAEYIDQVISEQELTENNIKFFKALKNEKKMLAFENALSPIFRFSDIEIGIVTFPEHEHGGKKFMKLSKEMELI